MRYWLPCAALLITACQAPDDKPQKPAVVPIYYDVGAVHREVTTDSAEAQRWFDRGLGLTFGFNHGEAVVCFEKAVAADPECAMAYWGKAYALGPNYNNPAPNSKAIKAAYDAMQRALATSADETAAEKALIGALRARFAWPAPEGRTELENAYAAEMRKVHASYPDDADVCALTGPRRRLPRSARCSSTDFHAGRSTRRSATFTSMRWKRARRSSVRFPLREGSRR